MKWTTTDYLVAVALFFVPLVLSMLIRSRVEKKVRVAGADLLLALIATAIALLLTGRTQKLSIAGFAVDAAFRDASASVLAPQVTYSRPGSSDPEALVVKQNSTDSTLGKMVDARPSVRYVVLYDQYNRFAGVTELAKLWDPSRVGDLDRDYIGHLELRSNISLLAKLPGYIPAVAAVKSGTSRQEALAVMDRLGVSVLPVVDKAGRFIGTVDRGRLTASIILDICRKLD